MTDQVLAVIYAAKSTEDRHGSIAAQIEDCREMAEREGWIVVGEYSDEGFSAYKGNRGPDLARARTHAAESAAESGDVVMLLVQHSDRISRGAGDKPGAAEALIEIWHAERRRNVHLRSVQDDFDLRDSASVANIGERNRADSERKSRGTRRGLKRRKESGLPVGALGLGYTVERAIEKGQVVTRRVIDPTSSKVIDSICTMLENGTTPGDVGRRLNATGQRTPRGRGWRSTSVLRVARNPDYKGENGYPAIIDPARWQRVQDALQGMEPSAQQRRKGGRPPSDGSYILRGIAFCRRCGSPLYTRRQAAGRVYVCKNRRQSTGLCDAPPIPASLIEGHVLGHLEAFIGDAERWLLDRVRERDAERDQRAATVSRLRTELDTLNRKRDLVVADYEAAVAEGDWKARIVLEVVAKLEGERELLTGQITDAEAVVTEWQDAGVNEALDYYAEIVEVVRGRIRQAEGAKALNDTLAQVVAGIWTSIETGKLHAEFELRPVDRPADRRQGAHLLQHARPVGLEARRSTLAHTAPQTFVWEEPDPDDVETQVSLSFRDFGGSTEVAFSQGPFKTEGRRALHRDGWTDGFDKLERLVSAQG